MSDTPSSKNSIEFIPANCPNCGGELRVPANSNVVKCMYCGHDVIIYDPNTITIKKKVDIDKIITVANLALNANNYPEAIIYFNQILEEEPENRLALLGKGFAIGMMSTFANLKLEEANVYMHKAFKDEKQEKDIGLLYQKWAWYKVGLEERLKQVIPEITSIIRAGDEYKQRYYEICYERVSLLISANLYLYLYPQYITLPDGRQVSLDANVQLHMSLLDYYLAFTTYYRYAGPYDAYEGIKNQLKSAYEGLLEDESIQVALNTIKQMSDENNANLSREVTQISEGEKQRIYWSLDC